jgi:hypothetical protein
MDGSRAERTQYNTYRGVADGDAVPGGCLDVDVVVADGHVGEGRPSRALECREEHLSPVLRELADDAVAAVADEREDVVHGEDGLGLRADLEAAAVVGEEADPAGARHGLGAHHAVLAAGVPHLHGDHGLGHLLRRCSDEPEPENKLVVASTCRSSPPAPPYHVYLPQGT